MKQQFRVEFDRLDGTVRLPLAFFQSRAAVPGDMCLVEVSETVYLCRAIMEPTLSSDTCVVSQAVSLSVRPSQDATAASEPASTASVELVSAASSQGAIDLVVYIPSLSKCHSDVSSSDAWLQHSLRSIVVSSTGPVTVRVPCCARRCCVLRLAACPRTQTSATSAGPLRLHHEAQVTALRVEHALLHFRRAPASLRLSPVAPPLPHIYAYDEVLLEDIGSPEVVSVSPPVLVTGPSGIGKITAVREVLRRWSTVDHVDVRVCAAENLLSADDPVGDIDGLTSWLLQPSSETAVVPPGDGARRIDTGRHRVVVFHRVDEVVHSASVCAAIQRMLSRVCIQQQLLFTSSRCKTPFLRCRPQVLATASVTLPIALRGPAGFCRLVRMDSPGDACRADILSAILQRHLPSVAVSPTDLRVAVGATCGLSVSSLKSVVLEANRNRIETGKALQKKSASGKKVSSASFPLTAQHFIAGVRNAAVQGALGAVPRPVARNVYGYDDVAAKLREAIMLPLQWGDLFQQLGLRPPRGILLHGPPGCSKTSLVRSLVAQLPGITLLSRSAADIYSSGLGEAEAAIRNLFSDARASAPSIVFVDEVEVIAAARGGVKEQRKKDEVDHKDAADPDGEGSKRKPGGVASDPVAKRVLASLLMELDGVTSHEGNGGVTFVAATNVLGGLDSAFLRSGRVDVRFHIGLPDVTARESIFRGILQPFDSEISFEDIAKRSEGYSGADITAVCSHVIMGAFKAAAASGDAAPTQLPLLTDESFVDVWDAVRPSVSE